MNGNWSAEADTFGLGRYSNSIFATINSDDRVTFLRSAPNRLPLPEPAVRQVVDAVASYRYDRIYGGWWEPVLRHGAADVVRSSAARYVEWLSGPADGDW